MGYLSFVFFKFVVTNSLITVLITLMIVAIMGVIDYIINKE